MGKETQTLMKKKTKKLIIGFVSFVVLLIAYFVLTEYVIKPEETNEEEQDDNIPVSQGDAENIVSFSYKCDDTGNEFLTLTRDKENVWHYEEEPDFPLNQQYVTVMAKGLMNVSAERVISEEDAGELSEYGFDNPTTTIRFTEKDGTENVFYIGNENPSTENYYFRKEGDNNVYQINADLKMNFMMGLYDLFDMEKFPVVEKLSFAHVEIQTKDLNMKIKGVVDKDNETYIDDYYIEQEKDWYISIDGSEYKMGNQITLNAMIEEMSAYDFYRAIDYNVTEQDLPKYGLDNPAAIITVDYQVLDEKTAEIVEIQDGISEVQCDVLDKQYKLYIGKQTSDINYAEDYYVRLDGSDKIYTMEESVIQRMLSLDTDSYIVK